MKITFNNKRGHRGRRHVNLLAARLQDGQQVIFEFAGKSIPGVITVVKEEFEQNGKWSASYWEVELADSAQGWTHEQDWETGNWMNSRRWPEALAEFKTLAGRDRTLDDTAIERFIRATWRETAQKLDATQAALLADGTPALLDLLAAQEELIAAQQEHTAVSLEVEAMEQAELARHEAESLRVRTAAARALMKKGASLADLKAIL